MTGKSGAGTRRRRKSEKSRRDQLLDSAAHELNTKGISLTSLTDVADRLGFSRASLYYYVEDREDLMFQVYLRSSEVLARQLGEAIQSGSSTLSVVEQFVVKILEPSQPELAALSEIGLLDPMERDTVLGVYEGVVARLAAVLEAGATAGEIRSCDFHIVARTIVSIVHSIPLSTPLASALGTDRHTLIAATVDVLTRGWAADRRQVIEPPLIDLSALLTHPGDLFDRAVMFEAKREKILAAASGLFNRRGVDTTSLDDIAAAVGATKRTLYTHVGDKQTIVSECYARTSKIFSFIFERAKLHNVSAVETLLAILHATSISYQREDLQPLRASTGYAALSEEAKRNASTRGRELVQAYRAVYQDAQREGSMRDLDRDCLLLVMRAAGAWLVKGLVRGDIQRKTQIAVETADLLRLGLTAL